MSHLKSIVAALILFGFVLSAGVVRADYQNEAGLSLSKYESDNGYKSDGTDLVFFHYFDIIETTTGPWNLADYIQRTGFVALSTLRYKHEYGTSSGDFNYNALAVAIANPESPFVFGLSYFTSETDTQGTTSYSSESDGYWLSIGYYIQQYTLVTFDHSESKTDYTGISNSYESETNGISISTLLLRSNGTAIYLSAGYSVQEDDDGDEFKFTNIAGDYYFNPRLGVGGFISTLESNIDINDRQTMGVNISYFLNPQVKLSAQYSETEPDNEAGTAAGLASESIILTGSFYF